ncbi:BTAD domain-containing putative transcriptional regulator [Kitasatospora sp. NPDC048239]|uniref:AfsR/SARP family transcriptional regulator n=1 Tax=Kitasatospora sp. NPDC048239 TaxID=3364046 RepID=UPI0037195A07
MEGVVRFSVLGAMRIDLDGRSVPAGPPQQQAMIAALLLRSGRSASLHELVSTVWGDHAPDSAVTSLRTYVWRLRQRLESECSTPRILLSTGSGYRLAVAPADVDAYRAEELGSEAARARAAGRHEDCTRLLTEAVALWRGEPLANVPGPFAAQQRGRLSELRLMLLEERFDHDLLLGRHAVTVPDLTAFTCEHPLRERPYGFLMEALYRCGRQAEALAVFARARRLLAEELGVEPGPELRDLHQRVLANELPVRERPAGEVAARELPVRDLPPPGASDTAAHPPGAAAPATVSDPPSEPPAAPPTALPAAPRPAQLPPDSSDFSGRDEAVTRLCEALPGQDDRALTVASVSGMGGIGKSTLALRVAHRIKDRYPGGQLYADLRGTGADAADPGAVLGSFLAALGVPGQEIPRALEDRTRLFRTVLDGRSVLLLLDDARDDSQVRPLLPGSAACAVVVTSRGRLAGLPATAHVHLGVFETDEALGLLRRVIGAERVDAEPDAARELVTACANLPLAVRIVAARLAARPGWTVASLVDRLGDERRRLTELQAGELAVAAVFELGYHQLTPRQAAAFRALAPVAGPGIGLGAAAAALGLDQEEAEPLLESLVDAALLESPSAGRYRYHQLVQSFACHLPAPAPLPTSTSAADGPVAGDQVPEDPARVRRRLLDFLLGAAGSAFQQMVPGDPVHTTLAPGDPQGPRFTDLAAARAWVTEEFDGAVHVIQLAVQEGSASPSLLDGAADLLIALSPFGRDIPYGQLAASAEAVAERAEALGADRAAGRALFVCGNAALQTTRLAAADVFTRRAAEACRRAGDTVILRQTFNDLGVIAQFEQRYADAVDCFDQALALARRTGHRSGELTAMLNAAMARLRSGRADEAVAACDEALVTLRQVSDRHGTAHALCVRGLALHESGRYQDALAAYQECLALCDTWHIPGQEAQARYRAAATLHALGRLGPAREEARRALSHYRGTSGSDRDHGHALLVLAQIELDLGRPEEGRAHASQAQAVFTGIGLPDAARAEAVAARAGRAAAD